MNYRETEHSDLTNSSSIRWRVSSLMRPLSFFVQHEGLGLSISLSASPVLTGQLHFHTVNGPRGYIPQAPGRLSTSFIDWFYKVISKQVNK